MSFRDRKNIKQDFVLANSVNTSVDLVTGELGASIQDIGTGGNILPINVSHVLKKENIYSTTDYKCGNFRLNLHQRLKEITSSELGKDYVFIDELGEKHDFKDIYYYTNDMGIHFIDKGAVKIDLDNKLSYEIDGIKYQVKKEQRTSSGLKLSSQPKKFVNSHLLEQRADEEKQLDELIAGYEKQLKTYRLVDRTTGYYLPSNFGSQIQLLENQLLLTESEALQYKSLLLQMTKATPRGFKGKTIDSRYLIDLKNNVKTLRTNYENLIKKSNYSSNTELNYQYDEYMKYLVKMNYRSADAMCCANIGDPSNTTMDLSTNVVGSANGGTRDELFISYAHLVNNYCDLQAELERLTDAIDTKERNDADINKDVRIRRKVLEQRIRVFQKEFNNRIEELQMNITAAEKEITDLTEKDQAELINRQVELIFESSTQNVIDRNKMYKENENKKFEKAMYTRQSPVSFLLDENGITRGFNSEGRLVAVFDNYENYASIIWDEQGKIVNAYDGENKGLTFVYKNNLLSEIKADNGANVQFSYDSNKLTKIKYSSEESIEISYPDNRIVFTSLLNKIDGIVSYTDNKVVKIENVSKIDKIDRNGTSGLGGTINEAVLLYEPMHTVITENNIESHRYFNSNNDLVKSWVKKGEELEDVTFYKRIENQYEITVLPEKISKIPTGIWDAIIEQKLNEDYYEAPSGYTLSGAEWEYVEYNQLGDIVSAQTNFKRISVNNYAKTITMYEYDDNQQLNCESTKTVYSTNPETVSVVDKSMFFSLPEKAKVRKIFYNTRGNQVETWDYVSGEEVTNGIKILERIYDKKGNVVRSFKYNSLDTSTKFYDEKEVAENGQIIADIDETGENKTVYEYDDINGEVKTTVAANNSKLSYGRDTNTGEITSITQSTSEGISNTTNKIYTNGCLTELNTELNKVNYEYDGKRRKTAVKLNGEKVVDYAYTEDIMIDGKKYDKVTTTIATGKPEACVVDSITDKNGNEISIDINGLNQITNTYNSDNLLENSMDRQQALKTIYFYNEMKQVKEIGVMKDASRYLVLENFKYDDFGRVNLHAINAGGKSIFYEYKYKDNHSKELDYVKLPGLMKSKVETDVNGRVKSKELIYWNTKISGEYLTYRKVGDHGTNMVASIRYGEAKGTNNEKYVIGEQLKYTYDKVGNITHVHENGKLMVRYTYDNLNRLVREDNAKLGKTYLHEYDSNGNILAKRKTDFTLNENVNEYTCEKDYVYDALNPDRLKYFGNAECQYDTIGNPVVYKGDTLTWAKGRQLSTWENSQTGDVLTFEYDGYGRRIKKGNTEFTYTADGKLYCEKRLMPEHDIYCGDNVHSGEEPCSYAKTIHYIYDQGGVIGLDFDKTSYYFRKNLQGDVTKLLDSKGKYVAEYVYDAWGNHRVLDANGVENTNANFIGNINPIRYRSYYYDTEIKQYFLQTRYYDPETARFINADTISILDESQDLINGLNLYAYCGNNPVMRTDPNGKKWWHWLVGGLVILGAAIAVIATAGAAGVGIGAAFGVGFGGMAVSTGAAGVAVGVASGIFAGAVIGGGIGLLSGGITSVIQGGNFWDGASKGFMWGAIGGVLTGGVSSFGGGMFAQGLAQGATQMTLYGARTAIEGEKFTIMGLLSAGFSGFAGGSMFKAPIDVQLVVNGLSASLDMSLAWAKKGMSGTFIEKFINNLFGKNAWNILW